MREKFVSGDDQFFQLQDRVDELEADRRRLLQELDEEKQRREAVNEQLEITQSAYQNLRSELEPKLIVTRGSDEEPVYYASAQRHHFHRPNCKWGAYILASVNLIEFGSHAEAVQAGYKPCKTCRA